MKNIFIFGALITGLGAVQAWATAIPACPTTEETLAYYQALSAGCQVGDKIFSNFTYTDSAGGSGSLIADSDIEVTTLGPTSGADPAEDSSANIGLNFSAAWSVSSTCPTATSNAGCTSSNEDSDIGFTVTVVNGANMAITDAAAIQTSSGALGTGSSVQVSEGGCSGAPCTPGMWGLLSVVTPGNYTENLADTMFSATGSVEVTKDISVTAGAVVGGAASLSSVDDTFSQTGTVPEPATMFLVGGVLCGVAVIRRRSVKS